MIVKYNFHKTILRKLFNYSRLACLTMNQQIIVKTYNWLYILYEDFLKFLW